jgi:hypothetical protein
MYYYCKELRLCLYISYAQTKILNDFVEVLILQVFNICNALDIRAFKFFSMNIIRAE